MIVREWQGAMRQVFDRLFELEDKAQDSGLTDRERAEHAELTERGHQLFDLSTAWDADPDGAGQASRSTR